MKLPSNKSLDGRPYHFCDPALQTRADMLSAEIWEVDVRGHHILVVAHHEDIAERVAKDELTEAGY
jgi:hypothetical protein